MGGLCINMVTLVWLEGTSTSVILNCYSLAILGASSTVVFSIILILFLLLVLGLFVLVIDTSCPDTTPSFGKSEGRCSRYLNLAA